MHLRTILLWKADELDDLTSIFQLYFPWSISFSVISLFQFSIQALLSDHLLDSAAQRFDVLPSRWLKKPFGKRRASPSLPFPPLHLHGSGSAELQALQQHSSVQAQPSPHTGAVKWDRKISNPHFPFLSRAYEHRRWHFLSHPSGHFLQEQKNEGWQHSLWYVTWLQGCLSPNGSHTPSTHPQTPALGETLSLFLQRSAALVRETTVKNILDGPQQTLHEASRLHFGTPSHVQSCSTHRRT